jgi:hypothetical protein
LKRAKTNQSTTSGRIRTHLLSFDENSAGCLRPETESDEQETNPHPNATMQIAGRESEAHFGRELCHRCVVFARRWRRPGRLRRTVPSSAPFAYEVKSLPAAFSGVWCGCDVFSSVRSTDCRNHTGKTSKGVNQNPPTHFESAPRRRHSLIDGSRQRPTLNRFARTHRIRTLSTDRIRSRSGREGPPARRADLKTEIAP